MPKVIMPPGHDPECPAKADMYMFSTPSRDDHTGTKDVRMLILDTGGVHGTYTMWLLRSAADSIQLGPEGVPFQALHVSILDRSKSLRDCCKLLRNSLSDIDAAFDSGEAALAAELKAVGFHSISRILPGDRCIFRFRDYFVDLSWVGTIVGNLVLAKGMVQALLLINNESLRICRKLHNSRKCIGEKIEGHAITSSAIQLSVQNHTVTGEQPVTVVYW
ncbi:hypothetical protein EDD18DRAFT_1116288 [Armillaria luteobubalina]|uniref:Uncharacterized protein n=1 Tax=Armillaria luteobubalina TaxID=153913 RepID=A0AA39NZZ3_9AGAR|nr:hypothetical protein EDD18DRAFT_1116288 [Armillaria luteobubalina]